MGQLTPVDNKLSLGGGSLTPVNEDEQMPQHDDSWMYNLASEKQIADWKKRGPIGTIEAFQRFDYWGVVPWAGTLVEGGKAASLLAKANAAANGENLSTTDRQELSKFLRDYTEVQARGYSIGGKMVNAVLDNVAPVVEIGAALLATAPTLGASDATIGASIAKVGVKAAAKKAFKEGIEKLATKEGRNLLAREATIKSATMLPSVIKRTNDRMLNDSIAVTDKGQAVAKTASETPAIAALKSIGEAVINIETAGIGREFRPLAEGAALTVSKLLPKKVVSALDELALTNGGKAVSTLLKAKDRAGFNGLLEELGENKVQQTILTALDLDEKKGYSFDELLRAMTYTPEELLISTGVIAVHGGISHATIKAFDALKNSGTPEDKARELVDNMTELEKEKLVEDLGEPENTLPDAAVNAEAPPGVEQTNDFTAIDKFEEGEPLQGAVEENVIREEPEIETPASRMDEALAEVSNEQQTRLDDVAAKGENVNIKAVDKARKLQLRSEIKVIDKELHGLSKQYDEVQKKFEEAYDAEGSNKNANTIKTELSAIEKKMNDLVDKRDALELEHDLVGKTVTNSKNEKVQMTREQANNLQKADKSKRILNAIKQGFDSGVAMTKASLKIAQKEYKNLVKLLPKSERGKVAFDFQKFNSVEEAKKNLPEFTKKIDSIISALKNNDLHTRVEKELGVKAAQKVGYTNKAKFGHENTAVYKELQNILSLYKTAKRDSSKPTLKTESKMSIAEAKAELTGRLVEAQISEKTGTFEERLVNEMLTYATTDPAKIDPRLTEQLIEDIKTLKEEGREAQNAVDLEKRLNKKAEVEEVINALNKYEPSHPIVEKLKKFYTNNIANMYSLFNAYMGRNIAEKYDPSSKQTQLSTAVYFANKKITDKAQELFGIKDKHNVAGHLSELSTSNDDLILTKADGEGVSRKLSILELMDIYNSIKNEDIAKDYFTAYGKDQILELVSKLEPEQMKFADILAENVRGYEDVLQDYSIRKFGLPLARRDSYWPATSEHEKGEYNALQSYIPNTKIPSAVKIKSKFTMPTPKNAWLKAQKHIFQAEYVKHLVDTYEVLDNVFNNADVRYLINEKLGDKVNDQLRNELEYLSMQHKVNAGNQFMETMEGLLGKWTSVKVASPRVFVRQLMAMTTYSAEMPIAKWTKYFAEGLKNPKATIDFMRKELPYLEVRFHEGYDDAISAAIREAKKTSALEQRWTEALTFFTKTGDIGSVMFGGYPYYKHLLDSGLSKEEAAVKFAATTEKNQQGKESSNLSSLQKQQGLNFFSRFLNSPNQFLRQVVDSHIQFSRGEMSKEDYAKKISQYLIVQPVLYSVVGSAFAAAGNAITQDEKKSPEAEVASYFFDAMNQIVMTPFAALPIVNELTEYLLNKVEGQPTYGLFQAQMFGEWSKAVLGIASSAKNENLAGVLYNFGIWSEAFVRIPVQNITKTIDTFMGGKIKKAVSNKKDKRGLRY